MESDFVPRLRLNLGSQQAALHYARELLSGNQKARSSHAHCWPLSAHWSAHPTLPTVRARIRRLCTPSSRAAPSLAWNCFVRSRSQGPTALPGYSSPEGWLSAESPGLDERRQQLQVRREGTTFLADSRQRTPAPSALRRWPGKVSCIAGARCTVYAAYCTVYSPAQLGPA
jgi:hypothetical protein